MKIIYISVSVIPSHKANSLQVMKTCGAIKKNGADIELLIPVRFGGVRLKDDPFEFYKVKERFKITKIFSVDLIFLERIIGRFGYWIQNISFSFFVVLYLLFKKSDVYFSRDDLCAFVLSFFKKNIFYEVHRLPQSLPNRLIFNRLLKKAKGFVVIAEELKTMMLKKFKIDPEKILVAHDGVDLSQFDIGISKEEAREKSNWPIGRKIVLYVGSLQYVKGVDILIKAVEALPDVYCYIIGNKVGNIGGFKDEKDPYENTSERIIFLGLQPNNSIPVFLKAADIVVIPHRDLPFSFSPLKLFEYMASKRPIIASRIKTLINVLGEDGAVYFESENSKDLSEKINLVLNDKNTTKKIVDEAFLVVRSYAWENRANHILKFVESHASSRNKH
jgi:glycosyltransferase involved in cell wall biosynthesis